MLVISSLCFMSGFVLACRILPAGNVSDQGANIYLATIVSFHVQQRHTRTFHWIGSKNPENQANVKATYLALTKSPHDLHDIVKIASNHRVPVMRC